MPELGYFARLEPFSTLSRARDAGFSTTYWFSNSPPPGRSRFAGPLAGGLSGGAAILEERFPRSTKAGLLHEH